MSKKVTQLAFGATVEDLRQMLNAIAAVPLLDGHLLDPVNLVMATPLRINHRLGRPYRGFLITKQSAPASLSDLGAARPQDHLEVVSDVDVTVTLWVF